MRPSPLALAALSLTFALSGCAFLKDEFGNMAHIDLGTKPPSQQLSRDEMIKAEIEEMQKPKPLTANEQLARDKLEAMGLRSELATVQRNHHRYWVVKETMQIAGAVEQVEQAFSQYLTLSAEFTGGAAGGVATPASLSGLGATPYGYGRGHLRPRDFYRRFQEADAEAQYCPARCPQSDTSLYCPSECLIRLTVKAAEPVEGKPRTVAEVTYSVGRAGYPGELALFARKRLGQALAGTLPDEAKRTASR